MKLFLTTTLLLLTSVAFYDERETIRDGTEKVVGTVATIGNETGYKSPDEVVLTFAIQGKWCMLIQVDLPPIKE